MARASSSKTTPKTTSKATTKKSTPKKAADPKPTVKTTAKAQPKASKKSVGQQDLAERVKVLEEQLQTLINVLHHNYSKDLVKGPKDLARKTRKRELNEKKKEVPEIEE